MMFPRAIFRSCGGFFRSVDTRTCVRAWTALYWLFLVTAKPTYSLKFFAINYELVLKLGLQCTVGSTFSAKTRLVIYFLCS